MNNVCLNLIKNKKLFLLLLSSFSLLGFSYKNNNGKKGVNILNDFIINISKENFGAFSSVYVNTNWKVLASDNNINNYVKSYNTFKLPIDVKNSYFYNSYNYHDSCYKYFQSINSDVFSTKDFLVNNKVTTREYYGEKTELAGYFQQYLIIYFKLINNTIYFKEYAYIYSGWCISLSPSNVRSILTDFNQIIFYNK